MRRTCIVLSAALLVLSGTIARARNTPGPSVLVELTELQKGSLPRVVSAFGMVEPSPTSRRTIMAPVAAVVEAVYVKPSEAVAANAPLIRLGPSPATAAAYTQAFSALRAARDQMHRTRSLLTQHLATAQQVTGAETAEADARASLEALKAMGAGGPRILRAPADVMVTAVSVSPGAIVAQGAALLDLILPGGLVLRAGVVPDQARAIRPGDRATIVALGGAADESGRVVLRGSVVDPLTGLVPIDIAFAPGSFLPGEMARANIVTGEVAGYVVPHRAILVDNTGAPYVVQAANGVARKVAITLLLSHGDKDVVDGPLDPAASVVLAGNHQLHDGMKVRVEDPSRLRGK